MPNKNDYILFVPALITFILILYYIFRKKKQVAPLPGDIMKKVLNEHVRFYQELNNGQKTAFENKVTRFLKTTRITGVKTNVEDIDRVFIAASAIIPVFSFDNWEYRNIHEILLYPGSFNEDFHVEGNGRDVLGMVGNGPMQNVMLLSQRDLRAGFFNNNDTTNTAIHEFVHLIDKTDGETDGIAEALMPHQYSIPWLKRIHQEMELIRSGHSDLNPYGTKNEAEFLAVAAEYFFRQPQRMQEKHPELYDLLAKIFMGKTS